MRQVTLAATQMAIDWNKDGNIARGEKLVREAASRGAQIILLQELFELPYFCQKEEIPYLNLATTVEENPAVAHFSKLAAELGVVIPVSFYERRNNARYNSIAVIDADGTLLGVYRKTHIPDGPGYEEKFYFSPGDTGFTVFKTRFATIGIGICWDQWFPETARCLALQGAELILYPTAIGSEPEEDVDSRDHWQTVMRGHAGANLVPVVASNRIGKETIGDSSITFYGSSFICDHTGRMVAEADRVSESVLTATFDLDEIATFRASWGVFRDRRPEHYRPILTLDGVVRNERD